MPIPLLPTDGRCREEPVRLLVIPGLHDSGPAHWQTWLEGHFRRAVRVRQDDWRRADVGRWADRIETTVARSPGVRWVAAAHSFGCLALARYLAQGGQGVHAALLVAPADPVKFAAGPLLPSGPLPIPTALIGSENDPWVPLESARALALLWGAQFLNFGAVGHLNAEAGFGPLPQAKTLVSLMVQRLERQRRPTRAHPLEYAFAV